MLFVPLTVGGALHWVSTGQRNKDGRLYSTGGALDLIVSAQFATAGGLKLNPATNDLLAGVYLVTDPAEAASPAQTVLPLSVTETRYAHAEAVYDKVTADERFMSTKGGVVAVKLCKVGVDLPPANEQEKGMLYIGV